jgi:transcriptional regulator with XRE-family HTH domain
MFWTIFSQLCDNINKKPNPVAAELKISSGTVTLWKNGSIPRSEYLIKLADYFGVSIDYLLGRPERSAPTAPELDPESREVLEMYRELTPEQQEVIKTTMQSLLAANDKKAIEKKKDV